MLDLQSVYFIAFLQQLSDDLLDILEIVAAGLTLSCDLLELLHQLFYACIVAAGKLGGDEKPRTGVAIK